MCILLFGVGEVYGDIRFLAVCLNASDEHHLIAFFVTHDCIVDIFHFVLVVDANVVDIGDDKSVGDACGFKFAVLESAHLNAVADT